MRRQKARKKKRVAWRALGYAAKGLQHNEMRLNDKIYLVSALSTRLSYLVFWKDCCTFRIDLAKYDPVRCMYTRRTSRVNEHSIVIIWQQAQSSPNWIRNECCFSADAMAINATSFSGLLSLLCGRTGREHIRWRWLVALCAIFDSR